MRGYCDVCGRAVDLTACADFPATPERGAWLKFRCECGNAAYVRENDLQAVRPERWAKAAEGKRQKAGLEQKTDNLRAHWLN